MNIKDSFKDLKNTLKMEIGKINIEDIKVPFLDFKLNELHLNSSIAVKTLEHKIDVKVLTYKQKIPKIEKMEVAKDSLKVKEIKIGDEKLKISIINPLQNKNNVHFLDLKIASEVKKFDELLSKFKILNDKIEIKTTIIDGKTRFENPQFKEEKPLNKSVKLNRLKKIASLPMIKKPVDKRKVNFVYVFEGKEYLKNLGYEHSDLIFVNYFDSVPMDLIIKIIIDEDELKLFYKKGTPKNIVDVVIFKSKRSKKLLLAPIKRVKKHT